MPAAVSGALFRCLVCEHEAGKHVLDKVWGWGEPLSLSRCRRCGHVQQAPLPARAAYDARYFHHTEYSADLLRDRERFLRRDEAVVQRLTGLGARGPLLDVGAGPGIMLEAAQRAGWQAIGLELSLPSLEHIRNRLGIEAHATPIERAPIADGRCCTVVFSHSLEHLLEPLLALQCARRVLAPGGFVHIAVPHWRSAKRMLAGRQIQWIFPGHISYFTKHTLCRLLDRAGFDIVESRTLPFVCDLDYRFAISVSERIGLDKPTRRFLRLGDRHLDTLLTDNLVIQCPLWRFRLVQGLAGAFLKVWPERLFGWLGYGEELRVTARRRG